MSNASESSSTAPHPPQSQPQFPLPPTTAEHLLRAAATASQNQNSARVDHVPAIEDTPVQPKKRNRTAMLDGEKDGEKEAAENGEDFREIVLQLINGNKAHHAQLLALLNNITDRLHTQANRQRQDTIDHMARIESLEGMVSTLQQTIEQILNGTGNISWKPVWGGQSTPNTATTTSATGTAAVPSSKGKAKAYSPVLSRARADIRVQPVASTSAAVSNMFSMSPDMAAAVDDFYAARRSAPPPVPTPNIEVYPYHSQIESLFSAQPPPLPQSQTSLSSFSKVAAPKKAKTVAPTSLKDLATSTSSTPTSPSALEGKPSPFAMSRKVSTVTDLWLEYSEGLNGLPSVFSQYVAPPPPGQGSTKRTNFPTETERKHFQRRRIILEEVERLSNVHGIEPKAASERLESFRKQGGFSLQKLQGVIKDGVLTIDL